MDFTFKPMICSNKITIIVYYRVSVYVYDCRCQHFDVFYSLWKDYGSTLVFVIFGIYSFLSSPHSSRGHLLRLGVAPLGAVRFLSSPELSYSVSVLKQLFMCKTAYESI